MGAVIFALIDPSTPFGRRLAVTPFDKLRARLLSMPVGILYGEKVKLRKPASEQGKPQISIPLK